MDSYFDQMPGSPGADYLKARGISGELIKHFRLGYAGEPLTGHGFYQGWISIPYITQAGVVGMRFRRLNGGEPRYLQEEGTDTCLYNVQDLHRPEPYIAITEGEFDAGIMSQECGVPAVGLPGVEAWERNSGVWHRLFEDYGQVFVVMDPDEAGRRMAKRIMAGVESNPMLITLPYDVNETYLSLGVEFIRNKLGLEAWE